MMKPATKTENGNQRFFLHELLSNVT